MPNTENEGMIKKSGDQCPISGHWQTINNDQKSFYIRKGEVMPKYNDLNITWVLQTEKRN